MSDARGLHGKFHVTLPDGSEPDGCMFILRPERDPLAWDIEQLFSETLARFRGAFVVRKLQQPDVISSGAVPCPDAVALPVDDAHARVALSAYAALAEGDNPTLAADLRAMLAGARGAVTQKRA